MSTKTDTLTPEARAIVETTPGGILQREFLDEMNLSQAELARRTGLPPSRITEIIKGRRSITAETAIALGEFFGNRPQFWLDLQTSCDLRRAEILGAEQIRARVQPLAVA
jgi:addiction module HigA family antidote